MCDAADCVPRLLAPEGGQNQALETFHTSVRFCLVGGLVLLCLGVFVHVFVYFFLHKQCSSSLTHLEELKQTVQQHVL